MADGEPLGTLINQNVHIPPEVSRLNGYTSEILERDEIPAIEAYRELKDYVGDRPVASYNLEFNWDRVLVQEWGRLGLSQIGTRGFVCSAFTSGFTIQSLLVIATKPEVFQRKPRFCDGPADGPENKKPRKSLNLRGFFINSGGQRGIRTPDTLFTYTRFPGVRLQPLGHLSFSHQSEVRHSNRKAHPCG